MIKRIFALILALTVVFAIGCNGAVTPITLPKDFNGLAVYFLDVGEGDATLIRLSDGKIMLIDCGESGEFNAKYISSAVNAVGGKIDYLVLSHPDADHVGNAEYLLDNFKIEKFFLPDLEYPSVFAAYYNFYRRLDGRGKDVTFSNSGVTVVGEDYYLAFLSPVGKRENDSPYDGVNISTMPSSKAVNSISPIIYLQYNGVRFLFTGDAPSEIENAVADNYNSGYFDLTYGAGKINLYSVDFLKVSHHGANDASSKAFLDVVRPKNAVVSVGKNNFTHPSTATLDRILGCRLDVSLWRTDSNGSIRALAYPDGEYTVSAN